MPIQHLMTNTHQPETKDPAKLADFILFTQREFLLNLSRELNRDNISFAQFFLLSYLASSKDLTMTDIARKMGHSTAAATGLVDRLEKLGYMERTHAVDDRRKVMVRVTAKGLDLVSRLREELKGQIADAMNEAAAPDAAAFMSSYRSLESVLAR
jgi:DNA-binding MarR family transcriptional regulator